MTYAHLFTARLSALVALLVIIGITLAPSLSLAQEDSLSTIIRAAISSDAQSENLTQEQIDALVAALVKEAQDGGVTAGDIAWRPQETFAEGENSYSGSSMCNGSFTCAFNEVFNFSKDNLVIPSMLLVILALLILIIAALIETHRVHPTQSPMSSQGGSVPPITYGPPSSGI